jgi:ubiquinone/menaquinone biosynthesis C-methylase UbiE
VINVKSELIKFKVFKVLIGFGVVSFKISKLGLVWRSDLLIEYVHGYATEEQQRLIEQAEYWRDKVLLRDLNVSAGEHLLELGCGVGAVLGVLGKAFPGLNLAGIDLQPAQIEYAQKHLTSLGLSNVDLRVGDASQLPWPDASFDHVYTTWFLEHVSDPQAILREAYRVLKPGGTITLNETDYTTILIWPDSSDFQYLQDSFSELFHHASVNPNVGRALGPLLLSAGFREVTNKSWGFYHFHSPGSEELRDYVEYICSCMEPLMINMTQKLKRDPERLQYGLKFFRSLLDRPEGAAAQVIYRGSAKR